MHGGMHMNKIRNFFKNHKFLIVVIGIAFALGILHICSEIYGQEKASADLLGYEVEDYEEYVKKLKDTPSDIEGLSQYDKYKMGLNFKDGSDSDYDGLTDKEEIEIYGTDPLKSSTAGDLYMDGYKVQNGMDLTKKYDYEGEIIFQNNECNDVKLEADEPTDLYATVKDCTERYSLDTYGISKIYKGYWMYNYHGTIKLDLTDVFANTKDVNVWVCQGDFLIAGVSELEKCKYIKEDNEITLKYEFNLNQSYFIYVTEKVSGVSSFLAGINRNTSLQATGADNQSGVALVYGFPLLEQFFNVGGHICYTELPDKTLNDAFLIRAIDYCNNSVLGSKISTEDTSKLTASNNSEIEHMTNLFRKYLPIFELKSLDNVTLANYFFDFKVYNDENEIDAKNNGDNGDGEQRKYYRNYHTEFDQYTDELPFQNFESEYAKGGNCAGISHLTAYLFNTGSAPASGSYGNITWNLGVDSENLTLTDRGLEDYKSRTFVDEHLGMNDNYLGDGLTAGEQEFVKMIGAYWKEANDKIKLNEYAMSNENGEKWDWSVAEQMTNYLDQGKIICASMLFRNGTGHEVNLYDYYYLENDDSELLFRVYDSNIPQNMRDGYVLNCDGACYLQCKRLTRPDGTESFSYLYYPIEGNLDYVASSSKTLQPVGSFVATDENWNVFK